MVRANSGLIAMISLTALFVMLFSIAPQSVRAADLDESGMFGDYSAYDTPLGYDDYSAYDTPLGYDDYSAYDTPLGYDGYSAYDTPLGYDGYDVYDTPLGYGSESECGCDRDGNGYVESFEEEFGSSQPTFGGGGYGGSSFGGGSSFRPTSFSFPQTPTTFYAPQYRAPQTNYTQPSNTTINNNNTNVNNNVNNNTAIAIATVTPVVQSAPQYQVVYQQPAPVYYAQPSCTISITNYGGGNYGPYAYNQLATLTWSSQNATHGFITNVGQVSGYGSMQVYPTNGMVYSMTVNGQGGTAYCTTQPYYIPVAPQPIVPPTPYVSLSQIPYTGFDFGTFGNAIYWMSLMAFAGAAAYLVLYFNGGAMQALGFARSKKSAIEMPTISVSKAPAVAAVAAPVISPIQIAQTRASNTIDTMHVTPAKDGVMPRIHISRA